MQMIFAGDLKERAHVFAASLPTSCRAEAVLSASVIGGGSTPGQQIASWVVAMRPEGETANQIESRLRQQTPPVIARIEEDRVLLDLRTVLPEQEETLRRCVVSVCGKEGSP